MKQKTLALLIVGLAISTFTFAQDKGKGEGSFHLGFKAGANIFKIDGKSFKDQFAFGYNLGGFMELYFSDTWGIQPEVNWNQTNYRTANEFSEVYNGGLNDFEGKLDYISIPVLLSYRPAKFISLQAGPQFGILIDDHKSVFQNGQEAFKKGDFSLLGGAQLNFGALKIGGRYVVGLSNINDIDNKEKWKNQGFQLYAGLRLF